MIKYLHHFLMPSVYSYFHIFYYNNLVHSLKHIKTKQESFTQQKEQIAKKLHKNWKMNIYRQKVYIFLIKCHIFLPFKNIFCYTAFLLSANIHFTLFFIIFSIHLLFKLSNTSIHLIFTFLLIVLSSHSLLFLKHIMLEWKTHSNQKC